MTWDVICHILQPFGILRAEKTDFQQGETLFLLHPDAPDSPAAVYISAGESVSAPFRQALIISVGPCPAPSDNVIEVEGGTPAEVFNALAAEKSRLDGLNSVLSLCDNDQDIIDRASIHLGLPMFYLDESYRILAITKSLNFQGDPEWIHMSTKGYLSPQSARSMKQSGELDLLASARSPMAYASDIYPFPSIVCNVWLDGSFVSRLNLLCIEGDTSPVLVRACELIVSHLHRIISRSGKLISDGPFQRMLLDLLHGVRLSADLIQDRLNAFPQLSDGLLQLFYVDVEAGDDRQIAAYYASALKRLHPDERFLPLVFEEQLILLAYAPDEAGFDSLTVKLAHFAAAHHLRCGVSNLFRRLGELKGHCDQAQAALRAEPGDGLHFYRDIMLEHMLSFLPAEQTRFLISPDILRLEQASPSFSFSLVETLRAYLECNCNLIRTAERLFLHKNTLLYRLNHIKGILRCDLNDADERLLLMLSFKLMDRTK